eukprot:TRINITY_DN23414_c0_g1_i1.p3 TRINITY_DN23414_c0_g1~~TRINITY_DN23414_c0_g1_i1.p3  ORF type:complete len:102 (-),score=0.59 TRINITY_DN23414_c0_g1_i1:186-491(-)
MSLHACLQVLQVQHNPQPCHVACFTMFLGVGVEKSVVGIGSISLLTSWCTFARSAWAIQFCCLLELCSVQHLDMIASIATCSLAQVCHCNTYWSTCTIPLL